MSLYAAAHEFAMRSFAILGGLFVAYLIAVGLNAAWESVRNGWRDGR